MAPKVRKNSRHPQQNKEFRWGVHQVLTSVSKMGQAAGARETDGPHVPPREHVGRESSFGRGR